MSNSDSIGWGVIGCGNIGPWHAEAVSLASGAELVAICDLIPERAQALADRFGVKDVYTSIDEMLKQESVQAVSICTPSGMHAEHGIQAACAGKHILSEKPMDIELAKIDALIAAAAENDVKLAGVFQRRTYEASQQVREAVQTGKLGKLVLGDCYQKYFRSHEYYASGAWRATWDLDGGGALMNQGVHGIDLLLYIMGNVKRLSAYARRIVRNIAVEDTAVAILEFVNGAVGVIEGTTSVTPGYNCKIEVSGDDGTIVLDESTITHWDVPGVEKPASSSDETAAGTAADPLAGLAVAGHVRHVEDLVDAIKNDREPAIGGKEARRAVEVIKAIYKSSREGGNTVELPLSYEDDGPGIEAERVVEW
jgi:predicted dehydrogenase